MWESARMIPSSQKLKELSLSNDWIEGAKRSACTLRRFDRLNSSMRPKSSSKAETEETDVLAFVAKNTFPAEDPTVATGERAGT